jgi:hypothetical protein
LHLGSCLVGRPAIAVREGDHFSKPAALDADFFKSKQMGQPIGLPRCISH